MKKFLIGLIIALLIVGIAVGAVFGIKALKEKDTAKDDVNIEYVNQIRDKYTVGGKIVYNMNLQDDKEITAVKYTIDHGEEVTIDGSAGLTEGNEDYDQSKGDYYYETGDQIISLTDLEEGTHVLTFYMYQDTVRTEISVHTFKLTAK